jgi:hypothetical protein
MTALIRINALPGAPLAKDFTVQISEDTARSLAGVDPLPIAGAQYALFWGFDDSRQVKTRLLMLNVNGSYYLRCFTDPIERWSRLFSIEIVEA